ncbi:hypothetical protein V8G54_004892 [Vigna mungo]|uniref:Uncharacterized protein n=1 Tax=Vigna mungo TaxID=3915 RepID=A0AAQ3PHW5_VIGMU
MGLDWYTLSTRIVHLKSLHLSIGFVHTFHGVGTPQIITFIHRIGTPFPRGWYTSNHYIIHRVATPFPRGWYTSNHFIIHRVGTPFRRGWYTSNHYIHPYGSYTLSTRLVHLKSLHSSIGLVPLSTRLVHLKS